MGRSYEKKMGGRSYKNYSEESLEEALSKIADGQISIRAASKQYKISFGTLYNKFKGLHTKKPGGQTVLTDIEEKCIINEVVKCGDWEHHVVPNNVALMVPAMRELNTVGSILKHLLIGSNLHFYHMPSDFLVTKYSLGTLCLHI